MRRRFESKPAWKCGKCRSGQAERSLLMTIVYFAEHCLLIAMDILPTPLSSLRNGNVEHRRPLRHNRGIFLAPSQYSRYNTLIFGCFRSRAYPIPELDSVIVIWPKLTKQGNDRRNKSMRRDKHFLNVIHRPLFYSLFGDFHPPDNIHFAAFGARCWRAENGNLAIFPPHPRLHCRKPLPLKTLNNQCSVFF